MGRMLSGIDQGTLRDFYLRILHIEAIGWQDIWSKWYIYTATNQGWIQLSYFSHRLKPKGTGLRLDQQYKCWRAKHTCSRKVRKSWKWVSDQGESPVN